MPLAILLSGPAGSGKSTFAKKNFPEFQILGTDPFILQQAAFTGKTYSEVFEEAYPKAEEAYLAAIEECQNKGHSFVLDRTHLTEPSRKKALRMVNPRYTKVSVYFPSYTPDILHARVNARAATGGHFVDRKYTDKMHEDYRLPKETEGFDFVASSSYLEKILKYFDWKEHGFNIPSHC